MFWKNPQFSSSFSFTFIRNTSLRTLLVTKCVGSFPTLSHSRDTSWVCYNLSQFWHYLPGDGVRSYRLRTQSHERLPPTSEVTASSRSPGYPQLLCNLLQIRGSHDFLLPWIWLSARAAHRTQKHVYQFTKGYAEGYGGQPDKEIPRVRSGRIQSTGASAPMELGCTTLLVNGCIHPPASSPNPTLLGFVDASSRSRKQLLTPFLVPLFALENWGRSWKFQASNHGLVLLLTSPHPGATRSPPRVTWIEQKMLLALLSLGNLQGF